MKKLIFTSVMILSLGCLSAKAQQGFFTDLNERQEVVVDSLTKIYTSKLVLTGDQEMLFSQKLGEYYLKKQEKRKEMNGVAKLDALNELSMQENGEMRDILTDEQFDLYTRIKASIQPLDVVTVADKN